MALITVSSTIKRCNKIHVNTLQVADHLQHEIVFADNEDVLTALSESPIPDAISISIGLSGVYSRQGS
jgi:hypothetical protein